MLSFVPLVPPANPGTVSRRESILLNNTHSDCYSYFVCDACSTALNLLQTFSQPDKYKKATSLRRLNLKAFRKIGTTS